MRKEPLTVNLLITYVYDWYLETSLKKLQRSNLPVMTTTIEKKFFHIVQAVRIISTKFNKILEMRLKQLVFDLIRTVNTEFLMHKKQAPFISLKSAKIIAKKLWTFVPNGRGFSARSKILRQESAVHLLLSVSAGGRWGDVANLDWSDIKHFTKSNGDYYQIMIRRSKNNAKNDVPQCYSFHRNPLVPLTDCPIRLLEALANTQNRPKTGKIFTTTSRSRLTITQKVCEQNGIKFTGHSGRVSMAVTLRALGYSKDMVRTFMNWKTDVMSDYYVNIRAQMTKNAPATIISQSDKILKIQEDLV